MAPKFNSISEINHDGWWYTVCQCNKKVILDEGMHYYSKCNKHVDNVTQRYYIKVPISDSTDYATFVIFDRDAATLFKKSAFEMIESAGEILPGVVPKDIYGLIESTFLFKDIGVVGSSNLTNNVIDKDKFANVEVAHDLLDKFNDTTTSPKKSHANEAIDLTSDSTNITSFKRSFPFDGESSNNCNSKVVFKNIKIEKDRIVVTGWIHR
ncbi:hypothetical protein TSUD_187450 [Trifolium subterraneum]|uniref:Replication factor A C-terminal domain-containing protein n=1 Tax=Trifolium subterraneum TaxID=3900 RepID=A0A2Z6NPL8_TRISU|nr:hypothetical protein TSUD_187450 [Trifolium subterraneum]